MKIQNFRSEGIARVAATVIWEDCDLPAQELYFETDEEFAQNLSCNPHAFLVACIMPAMHRGERRIFIDAEICPKLKENLTTAMSYVRHWCEWYDSGRQLVHIEAKTQSHPPTPNAPKQAGWFCSGGIDSLAILRANRSHFPLEHPESIKYGLLVHGFGLGKEENFNDREPFKKLVTSLSPVVRESGITLIPVYTNIRQQLEVNYKSFWRHEFSGSVLAAVAHAFSQRLNVASISSTYEIPYLQQPLAQHPLLDPNYSSYDLRIQHSGITLSRLDKTKLVADWDTALQSLRVCNDKRKQLKSGMLNCGKCEKCIRTMIALMALGKLDQTCAFPKVEISEEILMRKVYVETPYKAACYRDLVVLLAAQGRHDLVRGIQRSIARGEAEWWKRIPKQIDRKLLGGNLRKFYNRVFSQHQSRAYRETTNLLADSEKAERLNKLSWKDL